MSDRPANGVRTLSYRAALRETLIEKMQRDERVFMVGKTCRHPRAAKPRGNPERVRAALDCCAQFRVRAH